LKRPQHRYEMRGLPWIILHDVTIISCPRRGKSELVVPAIEDLHHAIARAIIAKRQRLMPREFRFLRRQLGCPASNWRRIWERPRNRSLAGSMVRPPMGVTADRLLRLMVVVAQGTAYSLNALRVVARHEPRTTPIHVQWHDGGWEAMAR
jgi:hypothetical protein